MLQIQTRSHSIFGLSSAHSFSFLCFFHNFLVSFAFGGSSFDSQVRKYIDLRVHGQPTDRPTNGHHNLWLFCCIIYISTLLLQLCCYPFSVIVSPKKGNERMEGNKREIEIKGEKLYWPKVCCGKLCGHFVSLWILLYYSFVVLYR